MFDAQGGLHIVELLLLLLLLLGGRKITSAGHADGEYVRRRYAHPAPQPNSNPNSRVSTPSPREREREEKGRKGIPSSLYISDCQETL